MSRTVLILGDTVEAWISALYVKRILARVAENVVIDASVKASVTCPAALVIPPRARSFIASLGLLEEILFRKADASFLLGAEFERAETFMLAYGQYGAPANSVPFHHYWRRMAEAGAAAPFDQYAFGAELARTGRFVHPSPDPKRIESSFEYGYTLGGAPFRTLLREEAFSAGVRQAPAEAQKEAFPWLVLDCSGQTGDRGWMHWPDLPESFLADERVTDVPADNLSIYKVLRSAGEIAASLHPRSCTITRHLKFETSGGVKSGRLEAPWRNNTIALGPSAWRLPGLHAPQIMLLHAQLDLLASLLPAEGAPMETVAGEYNRRATRMMDHVADFEALSLTPAKQVKPTSFSSPSLARKAEQFLSRGRPVTYDDELYSEQDWIAAFIAGGYIPERVSPLALAAPIEAVQRNYEGLRRAIVQAASRLPRQQTYLGHLMAQTEGGPDAV